jgi:hypothetical protein
MNAFFYGVRFIGRKKVEDLENVGKMTSIRGVDEVEPWCCRMK